MEEENLAQKGDRGSHECGSPVQLKNTESRWAGPTAGPGVTYCLGRVSRGPLLIPCVGPGQVFGFHGDRLPPSLKSHCDQY